MQQYENIKGIKIRHDRYSDEINEAMVCYITQKEAEEAISQLNKKTEWHAKIYQSNYEEFEENLKSNYEEKRQRKITTMQKVQAMKHITKDKIIKVKKE